MAQLASTSVIEGEFSISAILVINKSVNSDNAIFTLLGLPFLIDANLYHFPGKPT